MNLCVKEVHMKNYESAKNCYDHHCSGFWLVYIYISAFPAFPVCATCSVKSEYGK